MLDSLSLKYKTQTERADTFDMTRVYMRLKKEYKISDQVSHKQSFIIEKSGPHIKWENIPCFLYKNMVSK